MFNYLAMRFKNILLVLLFVPAVFFELHAQSPKEKKLESVVTKRLKNYPDYFEAWRHLGKIKMDSIRVNQSSKSIALYFNTTLSFQPIRETEIDALKASIQKDLRRKFKGYSVLVYSKGRLLEEYIPNSYRTTLAKDTTRYRSASTETPLVRNIDSPAYTQGLSNKHIAVWHSHGWYYEALLDRWEWQRARLFSTVEDLGTMAYVLPYLVPMLEHAGANVLVPRERDTQRDQVVVDNDGSSHGSELILHQGKQRWSRQGAASGFAIKDTLYNNDNPFTAGTSLSIAADAKDTARVVYLPLIPADGEYAVYVSWGTVTNSVKTAYYTVYHTGGSSRFAVNQTMGGRTWHYLGHFVFRKGKNYAQGRVELSNNTAVQGVVTADAVRFGGGMGKVARRAGAAYETRQWSLAGGTNAALQQSSEFEKRALSWKLSDRPTYMEGARYYLQTAGIPASVYSLTEGKNDYNDDYQSRGEWVNYLLGQHRASKEDTLERGLKIPIDLAFAFHTDAGVTPNDSIIGTLAIYNTEQDGAYFPNGQSKMASRDLSDLIQSHLVDDIRNQFNPKWTRRGLWDKAYSEAWRPKVPSMLLELLSHQNLADMRFSLDPRYRFAVSRAIYKGMLDYLTTEGGTAYVVQPLAPSHFSIALAGAKRVHLSWQPTIDSLEPTAQAKQYRVFMREGDGGFDNGRWTDATNIELELPKTGTIYSFKVAAVNEGGQSFDSEILSACLQASDRKPVLIVNGFKRISGPKWVDGDELAGIAWWDDQGVPYHSDIASVGNQYDFNRRSAWLDDDSPGWGASHADMEGKVIPGNTFDFTYLHGKAIARAGYSFVSMGSEAFEQQQVEPSHYSALDLFFGEQRSIPQYMDRSKKDFTVYTPAMMQAIKQFAQAGTGILVSGAYIGTDMVENKDSLAIQFAKEYLHYSWRTNHADQSGSVYLTDAAPDRFPAKLDYNTSYQPSIYTVEAPDAIEPVGKQAVTLFRYKSNNSSAGVFYKDHYTVVSLGFPFETIMDEEGRNELMKTVLESIR